MPVAQQQDERRRMVYNTYETATIIAIYTKARIADLYGEQWEIDFDRKLEWHLVDKTAPQSPEDHGTFSNWDTAERFLHSLFPRLDDDVVVVSGD